MTRGNDGGFEASKTMANSRMATPRRSIPVTVGTFEAWGVRGWRDTVGGGLAYREPRTCTHIYFFSMYTRVQIYAYVYLHRKLVGLQGRLSGFRNAPQLKAFQGPVSGI